MHPRQNALSLVREDSHNRGESSQPLYQLVTPIARDHRTSPLWSENSAVSRFELFGAGPRTIKPPSPPLSALLCPAVGKFR